MVIEDAALDPHRVACGADVDLAVIAIAQIINHVDYLAFFIDGARRRHWHFHEGIGGVGRAHGFLAIETCARVMHIEIQAQGLEALASVDYLVEGQREADVAIQGAIIDFAIRLALGDHVPQADELGRGRIDARLRYQIFRDVVGYGVAIDIADVADIVDAEDGLQQQRIAPRIGAVDLDRVLE